MKALVIFGVGVIGKLAAYYFTHDSHYSVKCFCVDDYFYKEPDLNGIPIIPASELPQKCPPSSHSMFIAIGYQRLNHARAELFQSYREQGYQLASYVSSRAAVMNGSVIGENCLVMEGAAVQPFATLGSNCFVWSNTVIAHEARVANHCFLSAGSIVAGMASVDEYSFLGVGALIKNGVHVGSNCVVGAGCRILNDLADDALAYEPTSAVAPYTARKALQFITL